MDRCVNPDSDIVRCILKYSPGMRTLKIIVGERRPQGPIGQGMKGGLNSRNGFSNFWVLFLISYERILLYPPQETGKKFRFAGLTFN